MKTLCVNHETYEMGRIVAVYHEDKNFLAVGDEAVIGTRAFEVIQITTVADEWYRFLCEDDGRKLDKDEASTVFSLCPHHIRP